LELMKAVRSDKDSLRSVAQVRNRTLAALGLSAAAATPFIEQELIRANRATRPETSDSASQDAGRQLPQSANMATTLEEGGVQVLSGVQRIGHLLHTPAISLTAGLLFGVLATIGVERFSASDVLPVHRQVPAVAVQKENSSHRPHMRSEQASSDETISAVNGLNNRGDRSEKSSGRSASKMVPSPGRAISGPNPSEAVRPASALPNVEQTPTTANVAKAGVSNPPVVNRSNAGEMHSKLRITNTDSATAK